MINTIIFSFDRAMQLEFLLNSINEFETLGLFDLHVIYATSSSDFEKGYEQLKYNYPGVCWHKEIQFEERFVWPILPFYWRNYYWWFKHKYNRHLSSDFKSLTLSIMNSSDNNYAMFLTDDSVFVKPINLDLDILKKIQKNGLKYSFSFRHGINILGGRYSEINEHIEWNATDKHNHPDWSYPFSVDGHIYNQKHLLKILKRLIFKNPNTLEGNVACYVREKKLFFQLFANNQSTLLGFELNRVQSINSNNNLNINNKTLNELYLKGYKLNLDYTLTMPHFFRPSVKKVKAKKNGHTISLYEY